MAMTEGRVVVLAMVPMLAGAAWLIALRRPEPAANARELSHVRASAVEATSGSPQHDAGYLGVTVAGYAADVGSEVGGTVIEVAARVGARVRAGDPLVRVDPGMAGGDVRAARAKLEQQRSAVTRAQADVAEASDLVARLQAVAGGVSDRALLAARTRQEQAQAALGEAQAGLGVNEVDLGQRVNRSEKHVIRAPFDGVVAARFVDPGALVAPGQVVARVITEDFYVRFAMPPEDARKRRAGFSVQVELEGTGEVLRGVVSDIQPEVDAAAQLLFARARLEAGGNALFAGARVRVRPVDEGR
jgi:RND family efflux transporter MFP subunit